MKGGRVDVTMQADGEISAEIKRSGSRWRTRIENEWKFEPYYKQKDQIREGGMDGDDGN